MISTSEPARLRSSRVDGPLRLAALACVLALVVVMVFGGGVADAAPKGTVAVFGGSGSGDGEFLVVAGVAVNQDSGDVYVVDVFNERVQQFDADGDFIRAWGGFSFGGNQAAGIAVDPTDGSVYVADTGNNRIQKFTAAGASVDEFGNGGADPDNPSENGELWGPSGVAVHPTSGDVVVADTNNARVQRFDSSGAYEAQFAAPAIVSPQSVAVDSTGAVYVVEQFGGGPLKFSADGAEITDFAFENANQIYSIAVDPVTDHVFAGQWFFNDASGGNFEGTEVIELDSTGTIVDRHRFRPDVADTYGVAVRSDTGRIYVAQTFEDRVFILDDPIQTASVEPTTDITSRTATLHGTVNPNGGLPVFYHFEVSADDGQTWTSFPEPDAGPLDGSTDIAVTAPATELEPNRDYLVRLVVVNTFGSRFVSPTDTFLTLPERPTVQTLPATQIRATGVTLAGEVNPNNAETTYRFEWGNTASYGSSIPVPDASAGGAGAAVTVLEDLEGLLPDTVYHYRIVATNVEGPSEGADRTFRTLPESGPLEDRGYELVSPAYKVGGQGTGLWSSRPDGSGASGFAAHVGERFVVAGGNGNVLVDSAFGYRDDWALGERTSGGWVHQPAVSRPARAPQPTTDFGLDAATPDLDVMAWKSEQVLKLFPEMAGWDDPVKPLLLRRWSEPQFEVFGPTDPAQDVSIAVGGPAANQPFESAPTAFADDGSAFVGSGAGVRGLAGPGDPTHAADSTHPGFDDRDDAAGSVYLDEISGPFSDVFPGDDDVRELVNVCTGVGEERTVLPDGPCEAPLAGRDWRLTSKGGAALYMYLFPNAVIPRTVISVDGSRVVFMSPDPNLAPGAGASSFPYGPPQLFVRQRGVDGEVMVRWIGRTEVAGQADSLRGAAVFEGASRDGDKVFFRTVAPLTDDDPNGGGSAVSGLPDRESSDLYMYDLPDGPDGDPGTPDAAPDGGELTRISAGPDGEGDCNTNVTPPSQAGGALLNVTPGTLRYVSDDGSRVYFTCAGPLDGVSGSPGGAVTAADGSVADESALNLYLYDANRPVEQRWSFVSRLPRGSAAGKCATSAVSLGYVLAPAGSGLGFNVDESQNCVRGTADGSLITFFTDGRLTADDPDLSSGDIYGYRVDRDEITRLTAAQGGAGGDYVCDNSTGMRCHGDGGVGVGQQTGRTVEALGVAERPNGDRLAFFESYSRLVAEDTDATSDVYQWREGELSLLTSGDSANGAYFFGNDRAGLNVYFRTRDRLTWQDKDSVLDVYTARVGGGIAEPVSPPVCPVLADGCQGGGAPAVQAPQLDSSKSSGRNVVVGPRKRLVLRRLTAAQLRRAARTGRIRVRVRASGVGKVLVVARARLAGRSRVVARGSKRVLKPGVVSVTLRLSGRARGVLARGRPLRLVLRASQRGAKSRSMTVRLRRNAR